MTESSLIEAALSHWERGLAWLIDRLELFAPEDSTNPDQIKEIAELSLFYGFSKPWCGESASSRLVPMRDFLVRFMSDPEIAQWVRKMPAHYGPYIMCYLPLRITGIRVQAFEEALGALHRAGYPGALENVPYRELELRHVTWKAGLHGRPPDWGATYQGTMLKRIRNPIYLTILDVYSITHTLFYVTDFAGPRADMPAQERRQAIEMIEPLLVHYWRKADWDVTGELLLNLVALDRSRTPLFHAAFLALTDAWREDGSLPGPFSWKVKPGAPPKEVFRHTYHTTLVGVLLCAAYLYRHLGAVGDSLVASA